MSARAPIQPRCSCDALAACCSSERPQGTQGVQGTLCTGCARACAVLQSAARGPRPASPVAARLPSARVEDRRYPLSFFVVRYLAGVPTHGPGQQTARPALRLRVLCTERLKLEAVDAAQTVTKTLVCSLNTG